LWFLLPAGKGSRDEASRWSRDEPAGVYPVGHGERRVVQAGVYGNPRQRFRCLGEVVNEQTGELRQYHRFMPLLRTESAVCDNCDSEVLATLTGQLTSLRVPNPRGPGRFVGVVPAPSLPHPTNGQLGYLAIASPVHDRPGRSQSRRPPPCLVPARTTG
jgi:hypothetical protein